MPGLEDGAWIEDDDTTTDITDLDAIPTGPGSVEEPSTATSTEPQTAQGDVVEELPEFDPSIREDFEGLLYLGRLTDQFTWMGHTFVIRTLNVGEILEAGILHKKYAQTLADAKAYQAAIVAACVVSVDGVPMPTPLTNNPADTELLTKFQYVLRSWFPPTLDVVYDQYLQLEARTNRVLEAMGKAPGMTDMTPTLIDMSNLPNDADS